MVKSREEFTVIEHTRTTTTTPINSRKNLHTHSISRGFSRGLCEYSDFFRDHIATTTAYWRRKERLYSFFFFGLELGLESSCFNPSQLRPIQEIQSFESRASELQELQSFRASNRGTKTQNTVKHRKTLFFDTHFQIL